VLDVAAYDGAGGAAYPPRERSFLDVAAYNDAEAGCIPTSYEVRD
jgi:hypothetical protein